MPQFLLYTAEQVAALEAATKGLGQTIEPRTINNPAHQHFGKGVVSTTVATDPSYDEIEGLRDLINQGVLAVVSISAAFLPAEE